MNSQNIIKAEAYTKKKKKRFICSPFSSDTVLILWKLLGLYNVDSQCGSIQMSPKINKNDKYFFTILYLI